MATGKEDEKSEIAVHGYVRSNFVGDCWVTEIIQIIIQFYVTRGGSLYMFGDGEDGCLGIEEYKDKICKEPTVCPPFDQRNALGVAAGSCHTLMLDIDGNVWSCGNINDDGVHTPQKLNLIQPVIAVAAGHYHSLILLKNGYVQSFGYAGYGQLGDGHGNDESVLVPKTIETLKKHKIIKIFAGGLHSFALTENGDLFCFGDNGSGQCGVGKESEENIMIPTKVKFEKQIFFIECGAEYTLLITCDGLIYSFGNGECGNLGHGSEDDKWTPTLIEALKQQKMKKCGAGFFHSICVDEEGIVWAFGDNSQGQCGLGTDVEKQLTPKVIDYFVSNKITAVDCAAGGEQSCIISEDGSLYVFGRNRQCQLGLKGTKKRVIPTKLSLAQNMSVKKVSMGCGHTAIICKE